MRFLLAVSLILGALPGVAIAQPLPGTKPLTMKGDLAAQMVAGIDKYLTRGWEAAEKQRPAQLKDQAFARAHLKRILGIVDERVAKPKLELLATTSQSALVLETQQFKVFKVRWLVLPGVFGEGLLLEPKGKPAATVICLPDADETPEMLAGLDKRKPADEQSARILAENGCRVLIMTLIDRQDTHSGSPSTKRFTNQPHREFVYRMAYEMGRHILGFEVQKVQAALDALEADKTGAIGILGYGEGGLVAFYSAALDERLRATLCSGSFGGQQTLWQQPIYRNVWDLQRSFGEADLAALIQPRGLVVEHCNWPKVNGPPSGRAGRSGAAPGRLVTPEFDALQALATELPCADTLLKSPRDLPGSLDALTRFVRMLGQQEELTVEPPPMEIPPSKADEHAVRQKRQFDQVVDFTQKLLPAAAQRRQEFFWNKLNYADQDKFKKSVQPLRDHFDEEVIGKLPTPTLPLNPRTRLIYDDPKFKGYEVVLDLYEDVFCYGILLVPTDIKPGEKRPTVVCQHGLEGRPTDVCNPTVKTNYYNSFGAQLARRGYIVFAPQAPYIGENNFRELLRKAHPLKQSLYGFIVRQHERILDWLETLPFVDANRIALYGLSYGGKVAMRIGALVQRYCVVICSGDFNEWIWKNINLDWAGSYMFTREYDMYEWNLGNTFNYAEMAALISPRAFMVERGHDDGVGLDEYVAFEYAKVRRHYSRLKLPQQAEIEFFPGGHVINGQATFAFLDRHLN